MKRLIIPSIILIFQILGYVFLYYDSTLGHADVPIAWIIFNFLGALNFIVLVISYFLYFRAESKTKFWLIPITIAIVTIIILIIQYIRMFMGEL